MFAEKFERFSAIFQTWDKFIFKTFPATFIMSAKIQYTRNKQNAV